MATCSLCFTQSIRFWRVQCKQRKNKKINTIFNFPHFISKIKHLLFTLTFLIQSNQYFTQTVISFASTVMSQQTLNKIEISISNSSIWYYLFIVAYNSTLAEPFRKTTLYSPIPHFKTKAKSAHYHESIEINCMKTAFII